MINSKQHGRSIAMIPKTVEDCWRIAFNEAERYQEMLTERMSGVERIKIEAKRDAASRIARMIKLGGSKVKAENSRD
jgi:hypothetical protein